MSDESFMHAAGESHDCIVLTKAPNKDAPRSAEGLEGRQSIKENIGESNPSRTQSREIGSRGLSGVREAAKKNKGLQCTALLHHVTEGLLRDSFYSLQRGAAPGVDRVTWQQYEQGLDARIQDRHGRVHRGAYRAQPSRRVYIPKADGRQRPLGIAALEDKIVQQAVVTILNQIYEVDFKGFSYGFRPGRSPHQALDALTAGIHWKRVNWVLDADIRGFFDNMNHEWTMKFIEHRVADCRMLRLIQKWLQAGVSEDGQWSETTVGTPQGAVASPLLANVYLHYVFDLWAEKWREKVAHGDVIIVRYADDLVAGFQHQADAEQFLRNFQERLAKFGLELHADKTRLIEFGRFAARNRKQRGEGKPETFTFLGFTHCCGTDLKGKFQVVRLTAKKRMRATLTAIRDKLYQRRHEPVPIVGKWLHRVLNGYFAYHAVPTNLLRRNGFRSEVCRAWRHALLRRSQRHRLNWSRFNRLTRKYVPSCRVLHPYPEERFFASRP